MVDICNATGMSNRGEFKGCEIINSPKHKHLQELINILLIFCEWKHEAGTDEKKDISWQSHEDLCWLVFGIVGKAVTYLKEDKSRTMNQHADGTDDCEHEFAHMKGKNNKPTQKDCREMTSRATGVRSAVFTTVNKSNTRGDKDIYCDEITSKLKRKKSTREIHVQQKRKK